MTSLMIYLWTRLDYINGFFILLFFGFLFGAFICVSFASDSHDDDEEKKFLKRAKNFVLFSLLPVIAFCFTPSQKEAAMIYIIPNMAQSETFNAISKETPEITKLALEALKETLQGMTKKEIPNER
jgi:hypothetical protein